MRDDHGLRERMKRLAGPVERQGVWESIEARASEAAGRKAESEQPKVHFARTPQARSRRLRLAAYTAVALVVVAGVTAGAVLGIDRGPGVYGVDNGEGGHWDKLTVTRQGGSNVNPLVMDPKDSSILYAGSGYGLYKSIDGAATWKQILSFGSGYYGAILDPESSSTIYVLWSSLASSFRLRAAQSQKFMRSDDGGNTWTELTTSLVDAVERDLKKPAYQLSDTLFGSSTDGSAIYVSARPEGKPTYPYSYWRSTDKGLTWELADAAERDRVLASRQIYPTFLDLWHEDLLDAEGRVVGSPSSGVVDSNDPSIIYAGTGTGVYKSTDKGKTWTDASVGMTSEVSGDFVIDPGSPSVLYVVGLEGIFKSGDAGVTWKKSLEAGYEKENSGNSICSLAIAPSATSTLYAWTSDGLFRSTDGGVTWTKRAGTRLVNADTYDASRGLALVAPDDPETVFASSGQDLLRSTDGGNTWTRVLENIAPAESDEVLMADPNDPSTMYATTVAFATTAGESNEFAAVKSVDGGATWKTLIGGDKAGGSFELVLDTNDPATIYMRQWRSAQSTSQSPGGGTTGDQVDLEDLKTVLSRSVDGGTTWEQIDFKGLPGLMLQLVCDPRSKGTWYAFTMRPADRQREIYRSTDGGVTWTRAFESLPPGCDKLAFSSGRDGALYLYGGSTGVYRWVPVTAGADRALTPTTIPPVADYSRGGQWKKLAVSGAGGRVTGMVMDPTDSQVLYAVTEEGLYRTSDGAGSWSKILEFTGSCEVGVDPLSPSTVYVVFVDSSSPKINRSDDDGTSWTELDNSVLLNSDYKMEYVWDGGSFGAPVTDGSKEASTIYMDTDSGVWRSVDRGASWSKTTRDEMTRETRAQWGIGTADSLLGMLGKTIEDAVDGWSAAVEVAVADPDDSSAVYAGTMGGGVFKSVDGGATWHRTSMGITSLPVNHLIPDPVSPSVLYAVTDEGIQKSIDGGLTWNLTLVGRASLVLAPSSPSTLYALNHEGISRSDDGGATWTHRAGVGVPTSESDPTEYSGYLDLVSPADPNIVFAQAGRDILRSADGGDTWTKVTDMPETFMLTVDPSQPTVMYLTARMQSDPSLTPEQQAYDYHNNPDWRLCKSVDSGATWAPIFKIKEDRVGFTILFDNHDPARLYSPVYGDDSSGSGAKLMRSLDGGLTWEQADFGGPGPSFDSPLFDPRSPDTVYTRVQAKNAVDTIAGLYRSTDGGTTWQDIGNGPIGGANTFSLTISPADGALYACSWSGLFKWVPNE